MKFALLEIGRAFDAAGKPLIVADGRIVGTVDEMKVAIAAFENVPSCEEHRTTSNTPEQDDLAARVIAVVRHAQKRRIL